MELGNYVGVCEELMVVSAHDASRVWCDAEFYLVEVVLSTYGDVGV